MSLVTRWPARSCTRATKFPRIVDRRWPTWKGFAMFGLLNSTSTSRLPSSNRAFRVQS